MQALIFTKIFQELGVEETGERVKGLGFDGVDLAVRPGFCVSPANAPEVLPGAVETWSGMGLAAPLISLAVDANDPADPETIGVFEAAGEAGVGLIKVGYFPYTVGEDYWSLVSAARAALEGFAQLSERTGVRTVYHTHSGPNLGSNCAGLMHLLWGFDPALIGAYVDMGHMAVEGEDDEMGLAMVRDHLAAIGAKDARFIELGDPAAPAPWGKHFVFIGQGATPWNRVLTLLHSWGFDGPFSVHGEYTSDQTVIATVGGLDMADEARRLRAEGIESDLAFLRSRWADVTDN